MTIVARGFGLGGNGTLVGFGLGISVGVSPITPVPLRRLTFNRMKVTLGHDLIVRTKWPI